MSLRIEMLNRALLRIGSLPLQSEEAPNAAQHLAVYNSVAEDLASKPFSFFKKTRRLVRQTARPNPAHYMYQFGLPPDRCGAPRAVYADETCRRPTTDYDIEGDLLLTNWEQIWATIPLLNDVAIWPGDFREAFTVCLMAELALSVREDRPLHDRLYQKARGTPSDRGLGGLIGGALEADSQAVPGKTVGGGVNPLIDVRA